MEKIIKALVTGGTGFTGSNLVKKLVSQNYQVRVLARSSSKTELLSQIGVEIVTGDIKDKESVSILLLLTGRPTCQTVNIGKLILMEQKIFWMLL